MSDPISTARCTHCEAPIVDETTQVDHSGELYCCPNCSYAMENTTGGSDRQAPQKKNRFQCTRCTCVIVHEATMEIRGDDTFCCHNCAEAHVGAAAARS